MTLDESLETEIGVGLGGGFVLHKLRPDQAIPREVILNADVILLTLDSSETAASSIAKMLESSPLPAMVFIIGNDTPSAELSEALPGWRRLMMPIDYSYLRGIVDSAHYDKSHVRILDEEQSRMRRLYELSSALLKTTHRDKLAPALERHLPDILDASVMMLTLPGSATPVVFFHSTRQIERECLTALRSHLDQGWTSLRPEAAADWRWLETIPVFGEGPGERIFHPEDFVSTPINRGSVADGFFTMLPRRSIADQETQLQTFLIIADMISVLLDNLTLKEKLEERATHDGLTGLLNRQAVFDQLEREHRRAQRYHHPLSIVVLDLDHFKSINDRFGHGAGDQALRVFSDELRNRIRENDLAGRIGGEEFLVVLPNTSHTGAIVWADRFREALQARRFYYEENEVSLTASLGVTETQAGDLTVDEFVARADAALYEAKRAGRNQVATR